LSPRALLQHSFLSPAPCKTMSYALLPGSRNHRAEERRAAGGIRAQIWASKPEVDALRADTERWQRDLVAVLEVAQGQLAAMSSQLLTMNGRIAELESHLKHQGTTVPERHSAPLRLGPDPDVKQDPAVKQGAGLQPHELSRELIEASSTGNDRGPQEMLEDSDDPMPESMFSYCMFRLSCPSPNQWCSSTCWLLILLLAVQQVLIVAFCDTMLIDNIKQRWVPESPESAHTCLFDHMDSYSLIWPFKTKLLNGQPWPVLAACIAAYVVIAWQMVCQDREVLETVYPCRKSSVGIQCLMTYAWFIQACFLPGVFLVSISFFIADSADALEIIMNTLAVTFLLDVDNMMYSCCLSSTQKSGYQNCEYALKKRRMQQTPRTQVFLLSFNAMFMVVSGIAHIYQAAHLHGGNYQGYLQDKLRWAIAYGCRGAAHYLAARDSTEIIQGGVGRCMSAAGIACAAFIGFAGLGCIYYLYVLHAVLGESFDIQTIQSCIEGSISSSP